MIERTYRISDVVGDDFLRFPLTLLANPQYREMSLEARFVYALLLNRLTLSQKNRWVNDEGEVYLIYTREEAANLLNISYKKAISAFKELIQNGLLHEQRQGRGYPNLLYVLKAQLADSDAGAFSESFGSVPEETGPEALAVTCQNGVPKPAEAAVPDLSKLPFRTCRTGASAYDGAAGLEAPKRQANKTDKKKPDKSQPENSPSVCPGEAERLEEILEQCELSLFRPHIRSMFRTAIERMYYSETLKIGNARLPQDKVRSCLSLLDADVLIRALESMKQNEAQVRNPTAYLTSVLLNGICEKDSALILSLPPEYLPPSDFYAETGEEAGACAPE